MKKPICPLFLAVLIFTVAILVYLCALLPAVVEAQGECFNPPPPPATAARWLKDKKNVKTYISSDLHYNEIQDITGALADWSTANTTVNCSGVTFAAPEIVDAAPAKNINGVWWIFYIDGPVYSNGIQAVMNTNFSGFAGPTGYQIIDHAATSVSSLVR